MARELSLGTLFRGSVDASFVAAVNELKNLLGGLNNALGTMGSQATAQKSAMRSLGSDMTELQLAMGRATNQSKAFQEALARGAERFGVTSGVGLKNLENSLYRTEAAIQRHGISLTRAGKDGEGFIRNADRLGVALAEQNNILKYTKSGIDNYGSSIKRVGEVHAETEGVLARFGKTLQSMAYWGVAAMTVYGVVNALKAGMASVVEFDQSLKNLQAITSSTNAEVIAMGHTILNLSKTTQYSAVEIASGMTLLAQAGLSAAEAIEVMNSAAILAQGTLSGMKDITDLLTTTMEAYKLQATDSGRIADVMAIAMNKSKLDVEKLRVAFSYLAPAASESGISLEETAAATSLLANAGLRASTIGTSFRQVLARLISPNEKLRTSFVNSGADLDKLNPLTNSLKDVLTELAYVVPNASKAFELFGLRAAPAVIQLTRAVRDGNTEYDEMLKSMFDVGAAQQMASKQMEGLGARTKSAANAAMAFGIALGKGGLGDVLGGIVDTLRNVMLGLASFTTMLGGQFLVSVTSAGTAVIVLSKALQLLGVGTLLTRIWLSFSTLSTAAMTLRTSLMGLLGVIVSNPFTALAVAVFGVGAGFLTWARRINEAGSEQQALAIESKRTEDRLISLRNELQNSGKESDSYRRAVKELAHEFKELAPLIDEVTGKWLDETSGMRVLSELIDKNHNMAMRRAIQSLIDYKREYDRSVEHESDISLIPFDFWLKFRKAKEVLSDLDIAVRALIPSLKEMGVTAETSLGELTKDLILINPDISEAKAKEAATKILAVLKKMQEDAKKAEEEAAKQKAEREDLLARGIVKAVPAIYQEMYKDLDGQRRADAEAIEKKLGDDIDKVKKAIGEQSLSYRAGYAQIIADELAAIEKMAEIKWKGVGTQADVNNEILNGIRNLMKKISAEYYNDRRTATINAERKIADAKGNKIQIEKIHEDLTRKLLELDAEYDSKSRALWTDVMENRVKLTREARDKIQMELPKMDIIGGMDVGVPKMSPSMPFGAVTDKKQIGLAESRVNEMIDLLKRYSTGTRNWAKEIEDIWNSSTEAERIALGEQMRIASALVTQVGIPEQIAKDAETKAREAIDKFRKDRDAAQKAELEATRSFQDKNRSVLEDSTKGVDPRVKAMGDYERELQKYRENTNDLIKMIKDDWESLRSATGKGEKIQIVDVDISKFKSAEEAIQYVKADSAKTEQFMQKQNELKLEQIKLEGNSKKLGLDKQALEFQRGILKDRTDIYIKEAEEELAIDKWAIAERLKTIETGGMSEAEIEQKVNEFKTNARKVAAERVEKLEADKLEAIAKAEQSHYGQLSSMTSMQAKAYWQLQEDLTKSHKEALEARAINEKYGVETITNIDEKERERNKAAYERYKEALTQADEKARAKAFKALDDELDAKIAVLQSEDNLRQVDNIKHEQGIEQRLQNELAFAQETLRVYTDLYPQIAQLREDYGVKGTKSYNEFTKKMLSAAEAERTAANRLYQEKHKYDEEYYAQGKISAEDYYNYLNTLRSQGALDEKQYAEKIVTTYGTTWEQLKLGWEQAKAEAKSWGETVVQIGKEGAEQIADGVVGALDLFGDSADSMAERFANAAKSILKWLAEMIIKQQLMNLLMGEKGSNWGGILGSVIGAIGGAGGGSVSASGNHLGGILGKEATFVREVPMSIFSNAQQAHSGKILGSDEVPVIGKKDEGIFTKGQMEALGVLINRPQPVVKTEFFVDPNLKMKVEEGPTRQEMEETIKTVHLKALSQDEAYLRTNRSFIGKQ